MKLKTKIKIKNMCNDILDLNSEFYDDSNGPYYAICPVCNSKISYPGNVKHKTMHDIRHDSDCPWITASIIIKELEESSDEIK